MKTMIDRFNRNLFFFQIFYKLLNNINKKFVQWSKSRTLIQCRSFFNQTKSQKWRIFHLHWILSMIRNWKEIFSLISMNIQKNLLVKDRAFNHLFQCIKIEMLDLKWHSIELMQFDNHDKSSSQTARSFSHVNQFEWKSIMIQFLQRFLIEIWKKEYQLIWSDERILFIRSFPLFKKRILCLIKLQIFIKWTK